MLKGKARIIELTARKITLSAFFMALGRVCLQNQTKSLTVLILSNASFI